LALTWALAAAGSSSAVVSSAKRAIMVGSLCALTERTSLSIG
jgi:hypothetical protein